MALKPDRVFIYGHFTSVPSLLATHVILGSGPNIAIEILREFSATELVGKVYVKGSGGTWMPASQPGVLNFDWYKNFSNKKKLYLVMQGSEPWQVLYFRPESDDTGPYVAVGLKVLSA